VPSVITVELHAAGDDITDLRLVHSQLPDAAARSHREGWGAMLDGLSGRLTQKEALRHAG